LTSGRSPNEGKGSAAGEREKTLGDGTGQDCRHDGINHLNVTKKIPYEYWGEEKKTTGIWGAEGPKNDWGRTFGEGDPQKRKKRKKRLNYLPKGKSNCRDLPTDQIPF